MVVNIRSADERPGAQRLVDDLVRLRKDQAISRTSSAAGAGTGSHHGRGRRPRRSGRPGHEEGAGPCPPRVPAGVEFIEPGFPWAPRSARPRRVAFRLP